MLSLAILLCILATPVLVGLNAFFRLQPSENRIGITSYAEVSRLRAMAPAICTDAGSDADELYDAGYLSQEPSARGNSEVFGSKQRFSVVTLAN